METKTITSRMSSKSNMNTSRTLTKNKNTTSRTSSKSNTTQQNKTDKQKDNGIKKKIKQTSRIVVVPIGALLLLLKVRKPLKKKVDAFFRKKMDAFLKKRLEKYVWKKINKFLKKTEIAARIKQLAIEKYDKEVPFITDIEREQDERYLSIYYEIADQEWKKFD